MLFYLLALVIVGLGVFIYFNRYVERKRVERREHRLERKEEFLQQIMDSKKRNEDQDTPEK